MSPNPFTQILAKFEKYHPSSGSDLDALLGMSYFGAIKIDRFGQIVTASEFVTDTLGYEPELLARKPLRLLFPSVDLALETDVLEEIHDKFSENQSEILGVSESGETVVFRAQFVRDRKKNPCGYLLLYDISQSSGEDSSPRYERDLNRLLLENLSESVFVLNQTAKIEFANPAALRLLAREDGVQIDEEPFWDLAEIDLIGEVRSLESLIKEFVDTERQPPQKFHALWKYSNSTTSEIELQILPLELDDAKRGCVLIVNQTEDGSYELNHTEMTEIQDSQAQMLNRASFEKSLTAQMDGGAGGRSLLAYSKLCDYQELREVWGGKVADNLLVMVAEMWVSSVPQSGFCGRLDSDGFVLFAPDAGDDEAEVLAHNILESFHQAHLEFGGREYSPAINIGVSVLSDTEASIDAVEAIYSAQEICADAASLGRNRYLIDNHRLDCLASKREHLGWIERINQGLDDQLFELHGQKIVHATDPGSNVYYELLVRMKQTEGDLAEPRDFLPIAEQYGLMSELDRHVVTKAMELLSKPEFGWLNLTVNLSGKTVGDAEFSVWLQEMLDTHVVDPKSLTFELTESSTVANLSSARELIDMLRSRGCKIALDDFGQGLSSFSYLKNLPIDFLKIDGEFIRGMEFSNISHSMVASINRIAHLLDIVTIGEGFETEKAVEMAREIGIDYLQGYAVEKPVPVSELTQPA